jgi:hypothetical protein
MDQGVILSMKQCYQADLLRTLANEDENIVALQKKMTVLDAGCWTWSSMNPVMPFQPWRKLFPDLDDDVLQGFPNREISKSEIFYMSPCQDE